MLSEHIGESMELLEIDERQKMRGYVRWETFEDGGSLKHCDYEVIEKTSRGTFIVKSPTESGQ